MTDFELIVLPVKQFKLKMQLILSNPDSYFPSLRKYILWDERNWTEENQNTWGKFSDMSWREFGQREPDEVEVTVVQEMDGDILSFVQSIDRNSDIRRTVSTSIHLDKPSYFESTFTAVWLNRLIQLQLGIFDSDLQDYRWFNLGSYMVTASDYFYNEQTSQLNLSLADLMASVTEHRGSQIGSEITIPMGESMQSALQEAVIEFFPFTFADVTDFAGETIPYDLEFPRGSYPYEIAKKIIDLYPGYEHYYSPDGAYIAKAVPMSDSGDIALTADQMGQILISENGKSSPQDIKNVTEVWGKELDAEYTALKCTSYSSLVYTLSIGDQFETLDEGATFAFTPDTLSSLGQKVKIILKNLGDDSPVYPLVSENGGGVQTGEMREGVQYVIKYTSQTFILQGPSIIHAVCFLYSEQPDAKTLNNLKEKYGCNDISIMIDRDSRFTIDWIGERVQVLTGGDYDNIYTTKLASERAIYETWKRARFQDVLRLETLYVPWLDVNQRVSYKSIITGKEEEYIIDSIQVNIETFSMTMTLSRYYPYYPWLRDSLNWSYYYNNGTVWGSLSELYWDEVMYPSEKA